MINWKLYNRRMAKLAIVMTDANYTARNVTENPATDIETARANLKAYDKASKAAERVCAECGVDFSSLFAIAANNYNDTMKNFHLSLPTVACLMESCIMNEETEDNESEVNENEAV